MENVITITLEDVLGPDGLEGAWEGMIGRLADAAASKFVYSDGAGRSFHKACIAAINTAIQDRISQKIAATMSQPIQRTDGWGNPIGEPVSFEQMIDDAIGVALKQRTGSDGKPEKNGPMTAIESALQRIAFDGLSAAIAQAMRVINQQAKDAVAKQLAAAIAAQIK